MTNIVILSNENIILENVTILSETSHKQQINCDILVIMPKFNAKNFSILTDFAIVYGDLGFQNIQNITYNTIISYGMSSKNTATISSVQDNAILVSTLRDFTNINGKNVEISEYLCEKSNANDLTSLALGVLKLILM